MREQIEGYIREYGRLIFSLCYSMTGDYFDAEDLAQDTFLSAYRNLSRFDGQNAKAWLTRIAANKCRDYLKSARRKSVAPDEETLAACPDPRAGPEETVTDRFAEEELYRLCQKLGEPYKTAAIRHFMRGESIPELASETGENPKTIHTRIYRARQMLKTLWEEENHA
jgi:RNA polymerase sigma-70 factor (ECF subfamily)